MDTKPALSQQTATVCQRQAGHGNMPRSKSWSHTDAVFATILALLTILFWYPRRHGALDMRWDGSVYYVLGTSLAQGDGYRLLNEPGNIQANQYPPMLPTIIAIHQKLVGCHDPFVVGPWLKLTYVLLSAFVIAGTYVFLRRYLSPLWAGLAAASYLLNLSGYLYFNMLSAELPLTASFVLFLLVVHGSRSVLANATSAAASIAGFLSRSIGIVTPVAWAADALLRRQYHRAIMAIGAGVICVVPWYVYIHNVESSPEYLHPAYAYQRADYMYYNVSYAKNMVYIDSYRPELGRASRMDLMRRVISNVAALPGVMGEAVTSPRNFWIGQSSALNIRTGIRLIPPAMVDALLFTIGFVVLVGFIVLAVRREWLITAYMAGTIFVVCTTPWPQQHIRYLSPSLPVLILGLFTAIVTACDAGTLLRPSLAAVLKPACVIVVCLFMGQQIFTYYQAHSKYLLGSDIRDRQGRPIIYKQLFYYPENIAIDECITWISQHARGTDVIAASMPQWVYARTGLKAVAPPMEMNPATATALLDTVPVRYMILETAGFHASKYVGHAVRAKPARWREVYTAQSEDVRVYERTSVP